MWEMRRIVLYEVIDEKGRTLITGLDENDAQSVVKAHNNVLSDIKWKKNDKVNE